MWRDLNIYALHFYTAHNLHYSHIAPTSQCQVFNSVAGATDRPYAYVVVTTKAIPELIRTPDLLKPLLTAPYSDTYPQPTYVLVQNGLNVEVDLYEALKKLNEGNPKIVSTALYIGANLLESNVVEHNVFVSLARKWSRHSHSPCLTSQNKLTIGMYRDKDYTTTINTPEETTILTDLGGILEAGGTTITIVPEIQRMKFKKNFWNVAFSSIATLTGYTLPAIFRSAPTGSSPNYAPYLSPRTAHLITTHTMASIEAILRELLVLGNDNDTVLASCKGITNRG